MTKEKRFLEKMSNSNFYNKIHEEKDHYGSETDYHGWAGNFHRYRIKVLKDVFSRIIKCDKNTTILDIGCSNTMLGEVFDRDNCPRIDSFDISDVVIEKAKKLYPYINFFVDDAQNFSFNGKKDIVFAGEIIEHLSDPREAFKKWSNCLKDGGYMILSTPNKMFNKKNEEHISLMGIWDIKGLARENKLNVVKIIGIDVFNDIFSSVIVKILAYDYARYGSISGKLTKISASTFTTEEGDAYGQADTSPGH